MVLIASVPAGEDVAIPTLPVASMTNGVASLASSLTAKERPAPTFSTESMPHGVVVPMPTLPLEFQMPEPGKYALPETVRAVVEAFEDIKPYPRVVIAVASVRAY